MPMDWHYQLPDDEEELMRALADRIRMRLDVAYPAIVQEDTDGNILKTKIAIKGQKVNHDTGEIENFDVSTFETVPLHFPGGGGKDEDTTILTHPVKIVKDKNGKIDEKKSDEGLIVFASRHTGNWWKDGGVQPPIDRRMNMLTPMFIPGMRSKPRKYKWHDNANSQLRSFDKKHVVNHDPHKGTIIRSVEKAQDKKAGEKEEKDPYAYSKDYHHFQVHGAENVLARSTKDEGEKSKTKNHTTTLNHDGNVISIGRPGKDNVHTHTGADKGFRTDVENKKHYIDVHSDKGITHSVSNDAHKIELKASGGSGGGNEGIFCTSKKTCDIDAPTHNVNAVTNIKKETTIDKLLSCKDNITCQKVVSAQEAITSPLASFGSIGAVAGGGGLSIGGGSGGLSLGGLGSITSVLGGLNIGGGLKTGALEVAADADGGLVNCTMGLAANLQNFADDAAAAAGGVAIGQLYHTSGTVKIRLT